MECKAFGAKVVKIDGLISDCGKYVAENKDREGWYDVSTLKEPYRVEGKKTMGYELWEQFGGELPEVILYPTGGGVGLIGMCKAFDEMQEMGWIGAERPRMVAVQAEGCAPIVRAWEAKKESAEFFANAATMASGLRVPGPLGDRMILRMLRQTGGTALTVSDEEMWRTESSWLRRREFSPRRKVRRPLARRGNWRLRDGFDRRIGWFCSIRGRVTSMRRLGGERCRSSGFARLFGGGSRMSGLEFKPAPSTSKGAAPSIGVLLRLT